MIDKNFGSVGYDNLFADTKVPALLTGVTLKKGNGVVKRGTILGKSPVDGKWYAVNSAAEPVVKRTLQITGAETKIAVLVLAGLTLDSLTVRVGDEKGPLATIVTDYTAAYTDDTLTVTVVALGALVDVAQCYIEIDKAAAGANEADCILASDTDTGDAQALADAVAEAYRTGLFNRKALIVAQGDSVANHEARLRGLGIYLKDNVPS